MMIGGEERQRDASRHAADLLERLDDADGLFLRGPRQRADFLQTGDDARHLLDGAERGAIHRRHHHRRHDRRAPEPRREQLTEARPLERAVALALRPLRRLGQERADDDQRDRRRQPGHQRVAPGLMASHHGRK